MNRKYTTIMILTLVLVFMLSGCASEETNEIQIEKIETVDEVKNTENVVGENSDKERISGEINKIVGNYITLELYNMPERGANKIENEDNTESPLVNTGAPIPGSGGGGGGKGGGAGMKTLEKSGEAIEIVIPVGTVIKSFANPDMTFEIETLSKGMSITAFIDSELTEKEKANNPDSNTVYVSAINIIENN